MRYVPTQNTCHEMEQLDVSLCKRYCPRLSHPAILPLRSGCHDARSGDSVRTTPSPAGLATGPATLLEHGHCPTGLVDERLARSWGRNMAAGLAPAGRSGRPVAQPWRAAPGPWPATTACSRIRAPSWNTCSTRCATATAWWCWPTGPACSCTRWAAPALWTRPSAWR